MSRNNHYTPKSRILAYREALRYHGYGTDEIVRPEHREDVRKTFLQNLRYVQPVKMLVVAL